MSSYAFKLASERPWEALVGPTGGDPINQDKVDVHMEGSHTSLLVRVYLALCSLESGKLVVLSYVHRSQLVHDCFFPSSFIPSPSNILPFLLNLSFSPPPSLPSKFLPSSLSLFLLFPHFPFTDICLHDCGGMFSLIHCHHHPARSCMYLLAHLLQSKLSSCIVY